MSHNGKSSTELKKVKAELTETQDKLLRAYAENQNIQKRMEKERHHLLEEIQKKYLTELIDLLELLKQAYDDKNPKEGIKLLLNNIESFLKKENITTIESVGKPFDYNLHHALCTIENEECDDNIVVEEIKKGYMLDNKLLRPAHVVVSKKKKNEGE